jgi:hypothetical protein
MYGWPRVLVRDGIVLFFAGLFTMAETDVSESALPLPPLNLGGSYVAGALALGYGLVVVTAAGVDIVGNYSNRAKS